MKRIIIALVSLILFGLPVSGQFCNPESLIHREILPDQTDANITVTLPDGNQVFINPACTPNDKLLIHLVDYGNTSLTTETLKFPSLAANHGYKAINLRYSNDFGLGPYCTASPEPDCYNRYYEEIIFGTHSDIPHESRVDSTHAIINRLTKLLVFLDNNYPSEGWGDFINPSGDIKWSNIVLSGHSFGGTLAAYMSKLYEVDRVLMFSAPKSPSHNYDDQPAWLSMEGATGHLKYYGFAHSNLITRFPMQYRNWNTLNMLSKVDTVSVDYLDCNYCNAQAIYTEIDNVVGFYSQIVIHDSTYPGGFIPDWTSEWEYMLGVCENQITCPEEAIPILEFKVFPNPTSDFIEIESPEEIIKIQVFDALGRLLKTTQPLEQRTVVDLDGCKGILLVEITTNNEIIKTFKIVSLSK